MDRFSPSSGRQTRSHSRGKDVPRNSSPPLDKKDYAIGIGLLLVVVLLWTSSNFLTQDLFESGYEKPFLVTYLNTSAFSLYLLPYFIRRRWRQPRGDFQVQRGRSGEEYQPLVNDPDVADIFPSEHVMSTPLDATHSGEDSTPLTTQETAKLAMIFCFFWFVANWSVNASLGFTTVASATILSSMSGFFTLGIGRLFHVEMLTIWKIVAVLTSFVGVLLVSLSDSSQPPLVPSARPSHDPPEGPNPIVGDALALLSAIFYALYVILLKVRIRSESRIDMQLFFGFLGLFNITACWPIGILLHLVGVEKFQMPSSRKAVGAILINMAITLSSDYIYVLAMLKTTPLVVTVGLSLTIPLAVLGDIFLGKPTREQVMFGAALVLISFIVVGVENARTQGIAGVQPEVDRVNEGEEVSLNG